MTYSLYGASPSLALCAFRTTGPLAQEKDVHLFAAVVLFSVATSPFKISGGFAVASILFHALIHVLV
jgi:hypothetical protein